MDVFEINLILLFVWYLLTRVLNKQRRDVIFCAAICVQLVILIGLRDLSIGGEGMLADIKLYETHYNSLENQPLGKILSYNDGKSGLFYLLLSLFSRIGFPYSVFVFIYVAFVIISFSWLVSKYSNSPLLSFLIYFGHAGFVFTYYLYRQCIAMALVLFAFHYLIKNKKLTMWIFVLLANLIHFSALIVVPFFFISSIKYNKKVLVALLLSIVVVFFYRDTLALMLVEYFAEDSILLYDSKGSVGGLSLMCLGFLLLFILFKWRDIKNRTLTKIDMVSLYGLSFAVLCQFGASFSYSFSRLNLFFFQMIIAYAIPNLFSLMSLRKINKYMVAPVYVVGNIVIGAIMIVLYFATLKEEGLM